MRQDGKRDYIEFPSADVAAVKAFYTAAFGWAFTDYGPDYAAFEEGLDGGFNAGADAVKTPLAILYASDLEAMHAKVEAAGGRIIREIQAFPGGRRFHFADPSGNELGVWSDA